MIGLIITGHGHFATGVTSALELLTGHQDFLIPVDFESGHSEEQLQEHLKSAFEGLKDCEGILVLCDILGGSPFKNAVTLSIADPKVRVLYGINLGMAVELAMRCMMGQDSDADALADEIIETGRAQIGKYVYVPVIEDEEPDEGI